MFASSSRVTIESTRDLPAKDRLSVKPPSRLIPSADHGSAMPTRKQIRLGFLNKSKSSQNHFSHLSHFSHFKTFKTLSKITFLTFSPRALLGRALTPDLPPFS